MPTCKIEWIGAPAPHDWGVNIGKYKLLKGQPLDVDEVTAGKLKASHPDSIKVHSGEPVAPGGQRDPVTAIKAAKRQLAGGADGVLDEIPELSGEVRKNLANCAKDADPRTLVAKELRGYAALWCRLAGRTELAQRLLVEG